MRDPNQNLPFEETAAEWLARRDRGMTAAEQDSYLQWLSERPEHGKAMAQMEKSWNALNKLSEWRPAHSPTPNPDLLAPAHKYNFPWKRLLAVAAILVVAAFCWFQFPTGHRPKSHQAIIHPGPERLTLEDGSVVELNVGAKVDVRFTPQERRVQLVRGEAHFAVAKNPARPFVVSADKFAVRAVGTAFSVALDHDAVSVLVTEGKVRLGESSQRGQVPEAEETSRELSHLVAGQKAIITLGAAIQSGAATSEQHVQISEVTPAEMERALSWQGLRLEFVNMPLGDVVAEFNRYNVHKLVVADPETAAIVVGGNFRADNINAFVRLLDAGFGVSARTSGNIILLQRSR
ncbi:MAG: FecR domain-containing protein [Nibricoccus sp.]